MERLEIPVDACYCAMASIRREKDHLRLHSGYASLVDSPEGTTFGPDPAIRRMHPYESLPSGTDIYLLDQIMKGRYLPGETILDAGAGAGRNLRWFVEQGYPVTVLDRDPVAVQRLREQFPRLSIGHILEDELEDLPFTDGAFQHVICSAVLHFAESEAHFEAMFAELVRVLRPGGSLFIRTATDQGLAEPPVPLGDGRFRLRDGSDRFLMTRDLLDRLMRRHHLDWLEPFKTVLVEDLRSMAVLVLGKTRLPGA